MRLLVASPLVVVRLALAASCHHLVGVGPLRQVGAPCLGVGRLVGGRLGRGAASCLVVGRTGGSPSSQEEGPCRVGEARLGMAAACVVGALP